MIQLFQAVAMSVLLYGCTTWILTKSLEKKLDGNYARILHAVLNKSWKLDPTKQQLYGHLPPIFRIQVRYAGYCGRSRDELINNILLWDPTHGRTSVGQPEKKSYSSVLCRH